MKHLCLLFLLLLFARAAVAQDLQPSTIANDASCDIALQPAATLLIPYFEVDTRAPYTTATTTIFTITNVSRFPQIANVTLWTTLDRPVMSFPIFLTGYDMQAINLYDVIVRGVIAPTTGTSNATTPGTRSAANGGNPRFLSSVTQQCSSAAMPMNVPVSLLQDVRQALTTGRVTGCQELAGVPDESLARGYVTVDLVATCTTENASSPAYWSLLLYDNVLMGDYTLIAPNLIAGNAGGNPMVHIRAVPEGGEAGSVVASPLPFTFYDRLLPAGRKRTDRRQPLPSTFVNRFIEGGTSFDTQLLIWRESVTGAAPACSPRGANAAAVAEIVRFDERENPTVRVDTDGTLPVAATVATAGELFPPRMDDVGGWLYVNLNNGGSDAYSAAARYDMVSESSTVVGFRQSQAWVTTRLSAEGRYSVAFDATSLGNGCTSAPSSPSLAAAGATLRPIGPAGEPVNDVLPLSNVTRRNDDSCDIAVMPAATLLVPYFEVDISSPPHTARTTLFTLLNTTNQPQIARVTMWSDWAYAALTFDIFLTGYDVQAINLFDVLVSGRLPGGGSQITRGTRSIGGNPHLLASAAASCAALPGNLPPAVLADVRSALTLGLIESTCGRKRIGGTHTNAIGYLTVDVVATCSAKTPDVPDAIDELLFDNVLTGDYQMIDPNPTTGNMASGSPAVHIRSIPEGGAAGEITATRLPRTFYDRFYGGVQRDRRQPLPSTFAARYIQDVRRYYGEEGTKGFWSDFLIWHGGTTGAASSCASYAENAEVDAVEMVRFDARENPTVSDYSCWSLCAPFELTLPVTARINTKNSVFPPLESGETSGWMYLNLAVDQGNRSNPRPNQAWVVTTMSFEGRYSTAFDAVALGNGCSAPTALTDPLLPIGPSKN